VANTPHPSLRLTNPAPRGTIGRTDEGVDWSNVQGNVVAVGGGVITRIYHGLRGFGTTVVETLSGTPGTEVYYAGETGAGAPVVSEGQAVQAGDPIAPGLGTGGIEVGYWNPATGQAIGASQGYTEGVATPAGQSFRSAISSDGASAGQSSSLAQLWIDAGGSPALANTMAAIAMAESGGKIGNQNQQSHAAGLWQILPSAHPQYNVQRLLTDPLYNAQAAVAVEKSQGLGAWEAYTNGSYKQFLGKPDKIQGYGGSRPGGGDANAPAASGVPQLMDNYLSLRDMPRTAPPNTKNPFQYFLASFTGNWDNLGAPNQ
jgi:hypothetical protein